VPLRGGELRPPGLFSGLQASPYPLSFCTFALKKGNVAALPPARQRLEFCGELRIMSDEVLWVLAAWPSGFFHSRVQPDIPFPSPSGDRMLSKNIGFALVRRIG